MEDKKIVELYWQRNEAAITETSVKYGKYCTAIAMNILGIYEDAEECVNDTYVGAWNSMPPHKPNVLKTFLGRITRNLSFNRYKHDRADKRGGGEVDAVLSELEDCVSGKTSVEEELNRQEIAKAIDDFLDSLSEKKRSIFVLRYWYSESISEISKQFNMKEGAVSMTLNRLRADLRGYLYERGFEI
ncbi:MAG: sigma-70 family RNA polymerase sigma factor [Oscillospiraceae bacterium]|nr:sigma-70 family RNA polymerase sigma factor [Oscillospiraceae bacterium]